MAKIFCLMGRSSTGKDTIYKEILSRLADRLTPVVPYTTRPIRNGETEGAEYHFTDEAGYIALRESGKIVEERVYETVFGPWRYFTVDCFDFEKETDYLAIGTPTSYELLRDYFGADKVVPLWIVVDEGELLTRALKREKKQEQPKYEEMCRRFLADSKDFAPERMAQLGIDRKFENRELETCICELIDYIEAKRAYGH